jgi:hypothetical protein
MPFCTHCGAEVAAEATYCSNCGRPRAADGGPAQPAGAAATVVVATGEAARLEPTAVVSLVVGILGVFQLPIPLVPNAVAILLGAFARSKIRTTPGLRGEGLATAGIILGVVGLAVVVLFLVIFFLVLKTIFDH